MYGPEPWKHRALGTTGEVRVVDSAAGHVEPDVVLYNAEHPAGKVFEHSVYKEHHGMLLEDFARTFLQGETQGVSAGDSLGESLTAMAIYRADASGQWENVFEEVFAEAEAVAARL